MSLIGTFFERMETATFAFAMDGKTDMMSLNPLEHTNFEMMGTIFGIGGVLFSLIMSRMARSDRKPDVYTPGPDEADGIDQYP